MISFIWFKTGLLSYFSTDIGFILWIAVIIIPLVIVIIALPKHSIMKQKLLEIIAFITLLIFVGIPIFFGYKIGYFQFWENIAIKIFGEGVEEDNIERMGFIIGWILVLLPLPLLFPKYFSYFRNKLPISKKIPIEKLQYDKIDENDVIDEKHNKKGNIELSFGWGKFWVAMGFIQGGIALVFSVIMGTQTSQLPNRGVGLIISILGIGSAYGLMERKLFGLYLVYATLVLGVVLGLIGLVSGEEIFTIRGAIVIVISILWFTYFKKRKEMFS